MAQRPGYPEPAASPALKTRTTFRLKPEKSCDITGFGADEIIIDDPIQPEEAIASHLGRCKVLKIASVQRISLNGTGTQLS